MKPDWKYAPEWANWLAQDKHGDWFWYALRPIWDGVEWLDGGRFSFAGPSGEIPPIERRPAS